VPDLATIAKPIQAAGYAGAAVTGSGATLVDEAIKQLDALRSKPAYLVVAEAHVLVCPKDQSDIPTLRALYDSAIGAEDAELGRFIAQLRAWSIWDQTMLIVTSNHGVELFEDGRCGHTTLRDAVIHVPLIIHDPSRVPGGAIVDEGVNGIDIFATILDAIGVVPPVSTDAALPRQSLLALAQGVGKGWPRPSYSFPRYGSVMRIGRWKVLVSPSGNPTISDLVADPAETKDLSASAPVERRMLTDNLGVFLALKYAWKPAWGVISAVTPAGADGLDAASAE
jgi:arylsulfatase A-like enzyme